MNEILSTTAGIAQLIFFLYLAATSLYLLIFAVASLLNLPTSGDTSSNTLRYAVLIPCFQEDEVILEVAREALEQQYPSTHFDIIIIADHFRAETIDQLKKLPLIVFEVNFEISTKTRAINYALRNLPDGQYDAVCILDADNIMESDFLSKISKSFSHRYVAVQGHRVAKNMNTSFAVLDAISEEINNQLFRKGQRIFGLSSALIGSAMAFEYTYFKKMMAEVEVVGGFDKELEIKLLKSGFKINYVPDAYVFDEKVQNAKVFSLQRRRWLSAQVHYFGNHFLPATKALLKQGNVEYFNKAIQYLQLPRILLLGVLFLVTLSSFLTGFPIQPFWWLAAFATTVLALLISVPRRFYHPATIIALLYLPLGFFYMFLSLLKIRGANKKFIHTKHTYNAFQIKKRKDFFTHSNEKHENRH